MAFTPDQLDALTKAISQGATYVKYGDKEVHYNSLADMLKLKKIMEGDVAGATGKSRNLKVTFNKGLYSSGGRENSENGSWQTNG